MRQATGLLVLLLVLGIACYVVAARNGWLTPGDTAPRARYASAQSKFIAIGDQSLHYAEQLRVIANCGHVLPIECAPQGAAMAKAFLDEEQIR